MYEGRTIRLRDNLQTLLTRREGVVSSAIVLQMRIDHMHVVITSLSGSLGQGSLAGTPGDLLASSIVTMRHVILIAHSDLLALIASQFQAATDIGCD